MSACLSVPSSATKAQVLLPDVYALPFTLSLKEFSYFVSVVSSPPDYRRLTLRCLNKIGIPGCISIGSSPAVLRNIVTTKSTDDDPPSW
jgi:hypothetical protein